MEAQTLLSLLNCLFFPSSLEIALNLLMICTWIAPLSQCNCSSAFVVCYIVVFQLSIQGLCGESITISALPPGGFPMGKPPGNHVWLSTLNHCRCIIHLNLRLLRLQLGQPVTPEQMWVASEAEVICTRYELQSVGIQIHQFISYKPPNSWPAVITSHHLSPRLNLNQWPGGERLYILLPIHWDVQSSVGYVYKLI